jgi:N-acetylglucosamine-6-phosphate deacetylase
VPTSLILTGKVIGGAPGLDRWIQVEGSTIVDAGGGRPPRSADEHAHTFAPGLVDVQVNGAGGRGVKRGLPRSEVRAHLG